MADRHLPVRPDLDQLRHQAKDLLRQVRRGDPAAVAELTRHHPERVEPGDARLADAQLALARSYGVASWPRLVLACRVVDAIWRDDVDALRTLVLKHPRSLHEMARGTERCNWGPPMSYAANLGRDRIIAMLRGLGARDVASALDRAVLQGRIDTARQLYAMGARPPRGAVMGPAETQNGAGMAYLLDLGAEICDGDGDRLAPVAMLLETYCRNPQGKHQCLELFAEHGIPLPDTPPMAVHRGRIDLLEGHLRRDPGLLSRTLSHQEIYPPELGCHADESLALNGTPLGGATFLHMGVEYGEMEIVRWLIERGMDVNARAAVDADGFGGHTALFGCVVSVCHLGQKYRRLEDAPFAQLLLEHGADPNARASLRKQLRGADDETLHEYRDVTPLSWGERFHDQGFVSRPAMRLIAERGGLP
jgi:hypothetical protein